ncbi:MAG TPA: GerMN domain-containing protein [Candidatus Saccharicenans sp.]|jgi:germination protein M|nr:GerMN domain-containing protein [Candidatus Saccharicenans sp.]HRD02779.1 GerMN domain-containing protein [Candidatus Saccharicenans sp.]
MKKNKSKNKKLRILLVLLVILAVLVMVFLFGSRKEKIKHESHSAGADQVAGKKAEITMKQVTLFFLSDNDGLLHPEEREIPESDINSEARAVVEELIRGPQTGLMAVIPGNTRLRQLFVTTDGLAYVDLSRQVTEANFYGSSGEMAVVYSIVDSLAYNFKSIKKVSLLIEGNERETLGGHVDLSNPFLPDYSLIAR